jgi:hypothetical protein
MPTTKEQRLVVRPELRRVTQPPYIAGPLWLIHNNLDTSIDYER